MPEIPALHIHEPATSQLVTLMIQREQMTLVMDRKRAADHAADRFSDVIGTILAQHGYMHGSLRTIDPDRCTLGIDVPNTQPEP